MKLSTVGNILRYLVKPSAQTPPECYEYIRFRLEFDAPVAAVAVHVLLPRESMTVNSSNGLDYISKHGLRTACAVRVPCLHAYFDRTRSAAVHAPDPAYLSERCPRFSLFTDRSSAEDLLGSSCWERHLLALHA
jgi:hypothetical protein